jgi:hypothetical protein
MEHVTDWNDEFTDKTDSNNYTYLINQNKYLEYLIKQLQKEINSLHEKIRIIDLKCNSSKSNWK